MYVKKITLQGFRCFGPEPVHFTLSEGLTGVVGANASGKTALLHSVSKLFGVTRSQRTLHRSDFFLPRGADPADRSARSLTIEALLEFPELASGTATREVIAPTFRHMVIERPQAAPVCRVLLEARWDDDGSVDGEVSQDLYWVPTLALEPAQEQKRPFAAADHALVQMIYVPAVRDPGTQIRATTGALAARLMRAIEWSEDTHSALDSATGILGAAFEQENAIKAITEALAARWSSIHPDDIDRNPRLSLVSRQFDHVISNISVIFRDGPEGFERPLEVLSEGQQSLFYCALAMATYDLERRIVAGQVQGFRADEMRIPALTIFALEEPENHLSPYFLARIMSQMRSTVQSVNAQAIITSHSPAVLTRVCPRAVRYCRRNRELGASTVKSLRLPEDAQQAAKFIQGAMHAFPELYFARFAILVEGDSERVVIPRLAAGINLLLDPSFVALVPIGGRHVQHFWQLLTQLSIPHATLLDLDLGKTGGGFGRVKTAVQQLLNSGTSKSDLMKCDDGSVLPDEYLSEMHTWQSADDLEEMTEWIESLRNYGVFFSHPLDFDLMMLQAFPEAYEALQPAHGGPRPAAGEAADAVFGANAPGLSLYQDQREPIAAALPRYRYHFQIRSKPATHLAAMATVPNERIASRLPEPLSALLQYVSTSIGLD